MIATLIVACLLATAFLPLLITATRTTAETTRNRASRRYDRAYTAAQRTKRQ